MEKKYAFCVHFQIVFDLHNFLGRGAEYLDDFSKKWNLFTSQV